MMTPTFTLGEIIKDVKRHCERCTMPESVCSMTCTLRKYKAAPYQINAFDAAYKEIWIGTVTNIAESLGDRFWWSDLRTKAKETAGPAHRNWWGAVTHKLKARGWRRINIPRRSETPTLRGSDEFQWTRAQKEESYRNG